MPSNDTEQLVVLLEARIRDFERNMAKASGTAGREFGAIERRGQQSAKRVEGLFSGIGKNINGSIKGFGGGLLAGGIAGLISEQAVRQLGAVVKSVADMADEAERIKLPVEDFQALGFVARQTGIEAGNVTDLFQKFQLSVGEAALKGNDLSKILEANGIKIRDANGNMRDQKSLFYDVVNLIRNAKGQQEAAVIAMAAFGKGAKDALPFLQQGADAIKEGEQAARDSGAVISKELVAKAQEFDDKWTATWDTWTAKGKSSVLEVLGEIQDLGGAIDRFVAKSGITSDSLRGSGLLPGLNNQQISELESLFPSLASKALEAKRVEGELLELSKKRAEIETHIAELKSLDAAPIEIDDSQARLDTVLAKVDELQTKLNKLKLSSGPAFEQFGRGSPKLVAPTIIPKLSGAADDDSEPKKAEQAQKAVARAIDSRREALRRLIESQGEENRSLEVEARAMSLSTYEGARMRKEMELLEQAKQAGLPITDQLKASIGALATEYAKARTAIEAVENAHADAAQTTEQLQAAQEKAAQASERFNATVADASKGFLADLLAGKDATEALQTALLNLSQQLASMAFDSIFKNMFSGGGAGKGLGGGGLGALLGFAEGGHVGHGGHGRGHALASGHVRGAGSGMSDFNSALSNGEFVVRADATAKHRKLLEMINDGDLPKFANGELVGAVALPVGPAMAANVKGGQVVNVSSSVTVNATGGSKEANADLARQVSASVETSVRNLVVRELRSQLRPGNMLNH